MKVVFINNRDSFVWNLVDYISYFEKDTVVLPNTVPVEEVRALAPDALVISPGPGNPSDPKDIGNCIDIIRELGPEIPLLGVCLGHQAINFTFGGTVRRSKAGPVHGKSSQIRHNSSSLFGEMGETFEAGRYHSLEIGYPAPGIRITARAEDGSIMAVEHEKYPIYGLQFHPESVLTPNGLKIIESFLEIARGFEKENIKKENIKRENIKKENIKREEKKPKQGNVQVKEKNGEVEKGNGKFKKRNEKSERDEQKLKKENRLLETGHELLHPPVQQE
ncbi:Anthranilate synthase, amidotransferase component [Methanosarcina sp. MTP4]|nr:Anthranilate synthase, amidotransferase component [Methanosarcina sp. MTP4]